MKRIQTNEPRRRSTTRSGDVLAELADRRERQGAAAEARREQQVTGDRRHQEVTEEIDHLETHIEGLLSADSEEFLIRFLQTEGQ